MDLNGKNLVDVTLITQSNSLNDVVIVGYGTQKKKDLTGAIGSISAKDFANKPFTSPDQILSGRLAGVNVTNRSGDPGRYCRSCAHDDRRHRKRTGPSGRLDT